MNQGSEVRRQGSKTEVDTDAMRHCADEMRSLAVDLERFGMGRFDSAIVQHNVLRLANDALMLDEWAREIERGD
jgi:hypothetical protein